MRVSHFGSKPSLVKAIMTNLIPGKLYKTTLDLMVAYGVENREVIELHNGQIITFLYEKQMHRPGIGTGQHNFIMVGAKIYTICFYSQNNTLQRAVEPIS